jgi:putative addiction module component (TIGR02574 family)
MQPVPVPSKSTKSGRWQLATQSRRLTSVSAAARKILEEALALSESERAALMAALSDSFAPPAAALSPAWTEVVDGRIAQLERGEVELVGWDQVEETIRAKLDRPG